MELREFKHQDWDGLAGAESGPNGEQPLVAYTDEATVVVDWNGVWVSLLDAAEDGWDAGYQFNCTFEMGKIIAAAFPQEITVDYLLGLGFTAL